MGWFKVVASTAIGAASAFGALWLVDRRLDIPRSDYAIAGLMLVFVVSMTWAFLLYLARRDRLRFMLAAEAMTQPALPDDQEPIGPEHEISVYTLRPGRCYQVKHAFVDYHGNRFEVGERLTYRERRFLPYHGGHTLRFEGRDMFLQEEQHSEILASFDRYVGACEA